MLQWRAWGTLARLRLLSVGRLDREVVLDALRRAGCSPDAGAVTDDVDPPVALRLMLRG